MANTDGGGQNLLNWIMVNLQIVIIVATVSGIAGAVICMYLWKREVENLARREQYGVLGASLMLVGIFLGAFLFLV